MSSGFAYPNAFTYAIFSLLVSVQFGAAVVAAYGVIAVRVVKGGAPKGGVMVVSHACWVAKLEVARQVVNANLRQMLGSGLLALTGECFTVVKKVVGGLARLNGRLLASGRSGAELTVRAVNETSFA